MMENQYSVKEEVCLFVSLLCDSITLMISLQHLQSQRELFAGEGRRSESIAL